MQKFYVTEYKMSWLRLLFGLGWKHEKYIDGFKTVGQAERWISDQTKRGHVYLTIRGNYWNGKRIDKR